MTSDDRKRELKAQVRAAERQRLLDSLPMDITTLKDLLPFLNKDPAPPCSHTHQETIEFLRSRDIDPAVVIPWLKENGGFCDCEVIYNVYDAVGDLVGWHLDRKT
ncbi:MAG: DUF2695 domain-containing protein [Burkholderiales bacterium]|nr:DUF2695 domain-containing protein [Burkholderiales bacterium]MBH2015976.1 DUF2695 domain-containing protein [Burkholderiales bacterium]